MSAMELAGQESLEGPLTFLELAPLLKQQAPDARIVLFTAHDLASEAAANPAVDGIVRKDRIGDLPAALRRLLAEDTPPTGH